MTFNEDFAAAIGLPTGTIRFAFTVLTVLAVTVGIQTVGVVLMAALLITPSAAARSWTSKLPRMLLLAALFASASALGGTFISAAMPKMPTGPWIVLVLGFFGFSSLILAPEKGWLARRRRAASNRNKTQRENLLKLLYGAEERAGEPVAMTAGAMVDAREQHYEGLTKTLRNLKKEFLVVERPDGFALTDLGRIEGRRVVRLHRLWELYLTERLGMAADHIHPQAETMEHVITPEIEALIVKELGNPEVDPHQSPIPYEED